MVSIGQSFCHEKELLSCFLVELFSDLWLEWNPRNVEACFFSLPDPVGPLGSLQTFSWPIPSILRLNNVELTIETKSHGRMTNMRASSIHDNRVKSIQAEDCYEVTRLDQIWVDLNFLSGSLLKVQTHCRRKEFDVGVFHVGRHMRSNNGQLGVIGESTDEALGKVP